MKKVNNCSREWLENSEMELMLGPEEIVNEIKKADREDKMIQKRQIFLHDF